MKLIWDPEGRKLLRIFSETDNLAILKRLSSMDCPPKHILLASSCVGYIGHNLR